MQLLGDDPRPQPLDEDAGMDDGTMLIDQDGSVEIDRVRNVDAPVLARPQTRDVEMPVGEDVLLTVGDVEMVMPFPLPSEDHEKTEMPFLTVHDVEDHLRGLQFQGQRYVG